MSATHQIPAVDASIWSAFEEWLKTKPEARFWNTTDAMLAAFIGGIAFRESAAARIGNSLAGPGLTTGESEPIPTCFWGRPSNQHLMGQGFCSEAHLRLASRWSKGFSHEAFDES